MAGYWKRIVASYTQGGHTFGSVPQFFGTGIGELFDYTTAFGGTLGTLSILNKNVGYIMPFIVPVNSRFANFGAFVNTFVAGGNARIGLYRTAFHFDDLITGTDELELVRDLGVLPLSAPGMGWADPVDELYIDQGYYFVAVATDRNGIGLSAVTAATAMPIFGFNNADPITARRGCMTFDATSIFIDAAYPQLLPVYPANTAVPRILFWYNGIAPGAP